MIFQKKLFAVYATGASTILPTSFFTCPTSIFIVSPPWMWPTSVSQPARQLTVFIQRLDERNCASKKNGFAVYPVYLMALVIFQKNLLCTSALIFLPTPFLDLLPLTYTPLHPSYTEYICLCPSCLVRHASALHQKWTALLHPSIRTQTGRRSFCTVPTTRHWAGSRSLKTVPQ